MIMLLLGFSGAEQPLNTVSHLHEGLITQSFSKIRMAKSQPY